MLIKDFDLPIFMEEIKMSYPVGYQRIDFRTDESRLETLGFERGNVETILGAEGFRVGSYLLLRIAMPTRQEEICVSSSMGKWHNRLTFLSGKNEDGGNLDYFCSIEIPREYDLARMNWCSTEDECGKHVRVLVPEKVNL